MKVFPINPADCPYYYQPLSTPIFDDDKNIIGYEYPRVMPCTLKESDSLREKPFPNEKGCSADPSNVDGFAATLKIIDENRNVKTSGMSPVGQDDCGMMNEVSQALSKSKQNEN